MHPQGSGGSWGLGSLGLDGDGDDAAPSRRRAWLGTGRWVENSRVARHVALGVRDVLLPHHVLGICQKNRNQGQQYSNVSIVLICNAKDPNNKNAAKKTGVPI
jgi:hypothetical protein